MVCIIMGNLIRYVDSQISWWDKKAPHTGLSYIFKKVCKSEFEQTKNHTDCSIFHGKPDLMIRKLPVVVCNKQQMTVVVDGLPEKAGKLLANLIWIGKLFITNMYKFV